MTEDPARVFLSTPGTGPFDTTTGGLPYEIRAPIESTGGAIRVIEITEPPRREAAVHVHDFDEAWYVLDGRYAVWIEGGWRSIGPGAFLFVPGGVPHGFAVLGPDRARKLSLALPGSTGPFDARPVGTWTVPAEFGSATT